VHVQRERLLAKFWIDPIALASATGFAAHELRRIERHVAENRGLILEAWNGYFGD